MIITSALPSKRRRGYSPATLQAFVQLLCWMVEKLGGGEPDPNILLQAEDSSPVGKRTLEYDEHGNPYIAVSLKARNKEKYPSGYRAPRKFDIEEYVLFRMLLLYGGGVKLNVVRKDTPQERHYLYIFSGDNHISLRRVFADTLDGLIQPEGSDRYDFRVATLTEGRSVDAVRAAGNKMIDAENIQRGREEAIQAALRFFDKNHDRARHLPIGREQFEWLLRAACRLVDERRAGARQ
jgi:hypothetical protein